VKSFESKGLHFCYELGIDNSIKIIGSKVDGSIQIVHTYIMDDMIKYNKDDFQFKNIIFSIHFEGKAIKKLDFLIKNAQECFLSLKYSENQSYYFVEKLESSDKLFKNTFLSDAQNVNNIQKIYDRMKFLPSKNEKPMLEFTLPNYILKKNLNNPENDLWIYLLNKQNGQTIVFSNEYYNLQILGDFKTTKKEFAIKINSQHLKYLGTEEYLVQVFAKYLLFSSKVKDSKFYITIAELSAEKSHE
jgi:hypothetical protein